MARWPAATEERRLKTNEVKRGETYYDRRHDGNVMFIASHPDDGACLIVQVLKDDDNISDFRMTESDCLSEPRK